MPVDSGLTSERSIQPSVSELQPAATALIVSCDSFADRLGKDSSSPSKRRRNGNALCWLLIKQIVFATHQERKALPLKLASLLSEHRVQFDKKFIFILPISSCEEDVCQGSKSPTRCTVALQYRLQGTITGSSKPLVGRTCLLQSVQN